ncbi:MAG: threonine--tRNA ligase, partial [Peptostreptococcaceae bacterium]|nr:threonine--tRNA ligase [Peptostreptococcaceae bacterium]
TLEVYRHSMAHILAKAVFELFGKDNVQYAIGPQTEDGCFYDFLLPRAVVKEDYADIENKMREILKRKEDFTCREVSKQEALEMFKNQKFKLEIINELSEDEKITVYSTGDDYVDLCTGPHVDNSQDLLNVAFQVKSVSGAYWKGDEKNDSLQRIYIYAFPSKEELKAHLNFIKEAMERNHKKIGPQLDLFMFDETAPGMPYWLPNGWKMFNALLDFWRQKHSTHGYQEISAPLLNSRQLWEISGHWDHYQENMFLTNVDTDMPFAVKPMNCPNAIRVFARKPVSYKDMPLRYSETSCIHRKEKSGELNGLFRVQLFRQDDAHTFITDEQIETEIMDIMDIVGDLYSTFGLSYSAELSTRPDDFMGAPELWDRAETSLKNILDKKYGEGNYAVNEGDGAFYGPKIDLKMKDCLGRQWQMGTIQLDFQLPGRFDLKYVSNDGTQKQPVMIHRALFGSFERFIGILIEHFKGAFPFWMSPIQVGIVPIHSEHNDYAKEIQDNKVRFETDLSDKNMKEKIKHCKNFKVPYTVVVGEKEKTNRTVSINVRGTNKQIQDVPLEKFVELCIKMNKEYTLDLIDSI